MVFTKENAREAIKLFGHRCDWLEELYSIDEITEEYVNQHLDSYNEAPDFVTACLLSCIWNYGRVIGIREERKRRRRA